MTRALLAMIAALLGSPAEAHRASDAYLTLRVEGARVSGDYQLALRDAQLLGAVDRNGDLEITWGELRAARPRLEAAISQGLSLAADGQPCALQVTGLMVNERLEGPFAWLGLEGDCAVAPQTLTVGYRLLFQVDPSHRGLLALTAGNISQAAVFSPDDEYRELTLSSPSPARQFAEYLREGTHHILIGADHILFLVALLLPSVLVRVGRDWAAAPRLRTVAIEVATVVTAFTVAHSVTLGLAALGILRLPASLTESVIALSVVLAAANNLRPVVTGRRWAVGFGFGLIHGFGFASVLGELGLPADARLLSLAAFNVGVEIGQMLIVAGALPLAWSLRRTRVYRRLILSGGSLAIAVVAIGWLAQRTGLSAFWSFP